MPETRVFLMYCCKRDDVMRRESTVGVSHVLGRTHASLFPTPGEDPGESPSEG